MSESSAEKLATYGVFAWYNIGWQSWRFSQLRRQNQTLTKDLWGAFEDKTADVLLLCECGEIVDKGRKW